MDNRGDIGENEDLEGEKNERGGSHSASDGEPPENEMGLVIEAEVVDNVNTPPRNKGGRPFGSKDKRKRKQTGHMKRQTAIQKSIGLENRKQVWDLVMQGKALTRIAEELGLSYVTVHKHFHGRIEDLANVLPKTAAGQRAARLEIDTHLHDILAHAKERLNDPRQAAIALKALEQLGKLHSVDEYKEESESEGKGLQEVSTEIRKLSPLLQKHLPAIDEVLAPKSEKP